jgi:hypothetical protein
MSQVSLNRLYIEGQSSAVILVLTVKWGGACVTPWSAFQIFDPTIQTVRKTNEVGSLSATVNDIIEHVNVGNDGGIIANY